MDNQQLKTGTTTIGLVCKEGIVLAADKRATTSFIEHKKVTKIAQITDKIALAFAGTVSDIQLLVKLIKSEVKIKDLQTNRKSNTKEVANLLAGLVYSNIRKFSTIAGITAFILGGRDPAEHHLYNLGVDGSVLEVDDYTCDGSGSVFAIGVLEANYKKGLTVEEGVKLAVRAINASIQRDMYSGNGIDVVTITDKGVQTVLQKELEIKIELKE